MYAIVEFKTNVWLLSVHKRKLVNTVHELGVFYYLVSKDVSMSSED